jgi:hypothetical protein
MRHSGIRRTVWPLACVAAVSAVAGFAPKLASTPAAPTITSIGKFVYVNGRATQYVGRPGLFKLSDPGSTVTGYLYAFDDPAPFIPVPAGNDGTATLSITPDNLSPLTLYVSAVNGSGNPPSPATSFDIQPRIAPGNIATLAWWKLSGGHGTTAADATGNGNTARLSEDATPGCAKATAPDGYKCSLRIGGHGGQALASPSLLPILANNGSFSVAAWVNVTKCAVSCVALSEDATPGFQFALKYQRLCRAGGKAGPCWKFSMPFSATASASGYNAASPPRSARLGTWTQLIGTFNAAQGTLLLHVNGVALGQAAFISPWTSSPVGDVRIGNLIPGGTKHDWNGRISDACLFYGLVKATDIKVLYRGDPAHPHDGCAALFAKYP